MHCIESSLDRITLSSNLMNLPLKKNPKRKDTVYIISLFVEKSSGGLRSQRIKSLKSIVQFVSFAC